MEQLRIRLSQLPTKLKLKLKLKLSLAIAITCSVQPLYNFPTTSLQPLYTFSITLSCKLLLNFCFSVQCHIYHFRSKSSSTNSTNLSQSEQNLQNPSTHFIFLGGILVSLVRSQKIGTFSENQCEILKS